MRKAWTLGFVALLAVVANLAKADFASAVANYQGGQHEAAFAEFRQLAELGHPQSQFNVGVMYLRGEGVIKSGPRAYAWVKIAVESGYVAAEKLEAELRPVFAENAADIVAEVESRYGTKALQERLMPNILPNCDFAGFSAPQLDQDAARRLDYPRDLMERGVEGDIVVEFLVGADGRARDARIVSSLVRDIWLPWLRRASRKLLWEPARLPDGTATAATASVRFNFRLAGAADYAVARNRVRSMKASAEAGDVTSQYLYGLIITSHPEFKKSWSDALPWFQKAATAGMPQAQYQLGYSLLEGRGCEPDAGKAMQWLELAARNQLPDAQVTLARMMLARRDREGLEKPMLWLRRAVAARDDTGRIELAAILAADDDAKVRDPPEALRLADEAIAEDRSNPLAHEIRAAALAAAGQYSRAVESQRLAQRLAGERGWDTAAMQVRLAAYEASRPWFGRLIGR